MTSLLIVETKNAPIGSIVGAFWWLLWSWHWKVNPFSLHYESRWEYSQEAKTGLEVWWLMMSPNCNSRYSNLSSAMADFQADLSSFLSTYDFKQVSHTLMKCSALAPILMIQHLGTHAFGFLNLGVYLNTSRSSPDPLWKTTFRSSLVVEALQRWR